MPSIPDTVVDLYAVKLAPQIIQSIEILQLNAIGLENYVKQEMLENPTLELADRGKGDTASSDGDGAPAASEAEAPPADAEVLYGEYRLRLLTLDPYPQVDRTIRPSDYVATLLVTR